MTEKLELSILRNLLCNEEYFRKVVPFIKGEYFQEQTERVIFEEIQQFSNEYDNYPTKEILLINLNLRDDLTEETYTQSVAQINLLNQEFIETKWLVNATEKWCQERAVYNALLESIKIAEGSGEQEVSKGAIPSILQEALAVSFDEHIGHDYVQNVDERYDYYHLEEHKIPFDIDKLNLVTKGGIPNKTLNVALAGTGVGKSLFMCHMAAACLSIGYNVLYITLEMAEEKIAERIDANLLNVNIQEIGEMPEAIFKNRVNEIGRKSQGKLIIKEYPTAAAHSGHFKSLLSDLSLKKDFRPNIIFVDYLNICASSRYKGHIVNSYTYVKAIAEELRGLAVEHDLPVVTATQTTRSGFGNSDVDLTDTSESFGLPATADLMLALISTEELEQSGRIMIKQLKNRYNDAAYYRRFTVGIDRSKMKLYNVDDSEGDILSSDAPEEETMDRLDDISDRQSRLDKFSQFVI
jgi:replicative DNA helicase